MFFASAVEDSGLKLFRSNCEHFTGTERRLLETVLIHNHRARLNLRIIPGPSQFVKLFLGDEPHRLRRRSVRVD
jgi:hypothetical protein